MESALCILISGAEREVMDALCINLSKKPTFDLRGVLGGSATDAERGGIEGASLWLWAVLVLSGSGGGASSVSSSPFSGKCKQQPILTVNWTIVRIKRNRTE